MVNLPPDSICDVLINFLHDRFDNVRVYWID